MTLWPLLLIAALAGVGFPLAYRWRRGHTGHPVIRRRWVAVDGVRCIGHFDTWRAAAQAAQDDRDQLGGAL